MCYEISCVIPAFNEEELIERQVLKIISVLEELFDNYEIIIINDGSTDKTKEIINRLSTTYPFIKSIHHQKNLGYGKALATGFLNARLEWVFYTDADNQFDISDIKKFLPHISSDKILVGYRVARKDSRRRIFYSHIFNLLVNILAGIKIKDVNCAFKLFPQKLFSQISLQSNGFLIDAEILSKAKQAGYIFQEIAVHHYPRLAGKSKVNFFHSYKTIKEIYKLYSNVNTKE